MIIRPIFPASELRFVCLYCRRCTGTHLVESYLWLAIAYTLATFDFTKATDADGNVIEPQPQYLDASFRYALFEQAKAVFYFTEADFYARPKTTYIVSMHHPSKVRKRCAAGS